MRLTLHQRAVGSTPTRPTKFNDLRGIYSCRGESDGLDDGVEVVNACLKIDRPCAHRPVSDDLTCRHPREPLNQAGSSRAYGTLWP